jgi:hypothetical protein
MHGPGLPNSGDAAMPAFQELSMQSRVQHIPSKDAQHRRLFTILQAPLTPAKPMLL